jgi:ABC-type transporter Mla subunit MlaD
MEVKIPVNTTAKIFIPASNKESVQINGVAVDEVENIEIIDYVDGKLIVSVGSGYFSIESIAGASL